MSVSFETIVKNYKQVIHDLSDYQYEHDPFYEYPGDVNSSVTIKENSHSIDPLHAMMMCNVIESINYRYPNIKHDRSVLEIGSHSGFSTHYLTQLNLNLTIIECDPQNTLSQLVSKTNISAWFTTTSRCQQIGQLDGPFDFIFIDGNHDANSTQLDVLYSQSLAHADTIFVLHDTNLCAAMPELPPHTSNGPQIQMNVFINNGWHVIEDKVKRPGMRTERGLAFITKNPEYAKMIEEEVTRSITRTNANFNS